ncbi:MAG: bromodomain-containing protein [Heteroscytonema crispum UTEX LB 1556]
MDFKYRWKNGAQPSRDEAARNAHLLDESQFENEKDRNLAEEAARKHLNVPTRVPDQDRPVLPTAPPPDRKV